MNKFYKVALTALTTALISVSALASPHGAWHDRHPAKPSHTQQHKPTYSAQHRHPAYQQTQQRFNDRGAHRWQTQHKLPSMYLNSRYKVNAYQRHQLSKPDRNQAWYKVDGYYLLTNLNNNRIIKFVKA